MSYHYAIEKVKALSKNTIFIINAGGWFVGNSAVLEWLDGFPEVSFIPGDFDILREEGGLFDLIISTTERSDVDNAFKEIKYFLWRKLFKLVKFRVADYTKYLFTTHRYSYKNHDRQFAFYYRLFRKVAYFEKNHQNIDIYGYWRDWIVEEARLFNPNKELKYVLLQNPFYYRSFAPHHEVVWKELFVNRKVIFVCRNHLDQYKTIKDAGQLIHTKHTPFRKGTETLNEKDRFFCLNTKLYESRIEFVQDRHEEIMLVNFEDFVRELKSKDLISFLGLNKNTNIYFDFNYSRKNVGISQQDQNAQDFYRENLIRFAELEGLKNKLNQEYDNRVLFN